MRDEIPYRSNYVNLAIRLPIDYIATKLMDRCTPEEAMLAMRDGVREYLLERLEHLFELEFPKAAEGVLRELQAINGPIAEAFRKQELAKGEINLKFDFSFPVANALIESKQDGASPAG